MTREVSDEKRCTAKSKQRQDRCRRYVSPGKRVCIMHGGRVDTSKRPLQPARKHGLSSSMLPAEQRPAFDAAVKAIEGDNGVDIATRRTAIRIACIEQFYIEHPKGPQTEQEHEALARALADVDRGLLTRKQLLEEEPKADAPFTITIGQPGSDRVMVRTPSGPATALRAPDGGLLLPDGRGAYVPAVRRDVDGIEVWSPTLKLSGTGGNE